MYGWGNPNAYGCNYPTEEADPLEDDKILIGQREKLETYENRLETLEERLDEAREDKRDAQKAILKVVTDRAI